MRQHIQRLRHKRRRHNAAWLMGFIRFANGLGRLLYSLPFLPCCVILRRMPFAVFGRACAKMMKKQSV